jgi:hypothetical protein
LTRVGEIVLVGDCPAVRIRSDLVDDYAGATGSDDVERFSRIAGSNDNLSSLQVTRRSGEMLLQFSSERRRRRSHLSAVQFRRVHRRGRYDDGSGLSLPNRSLFDRMQTVQSAAKLR